MNVAAMPAEWNEVARVPAAAYARLTGDMVGAGQLSGGMVTSANIAGHVMEYQSAAEPPQPGEARVRRAPVRFRPPGPF